MKILLITHIYPPAIDGGSRVIAKLGEYLKLDGHQITVLTTNCLSTDDFVNPKSKTSSFFKGGRSDAISDQEGFIFRLPVYKSLRRPLKLINLIFPTNSYVSDLLKIFQKGPIFKIIPLIKFMLKVHYENFDLIIAGPLPTTIVIYANFFKKIFHSRLLINASYHQTDPDFLRIPLSKTLQKADHIWALTQYEKSYFIKTLNIDPKKIILAGNGIDKNILINPKNIKFPIKPNLLFIGSFAKHKQIELLINAFSKISLNYPYLTLTLAGQKTLYFPNIQKCILNQPKSIRQKIFFHYNFPQSKLIKLIDDSTILVLPSLQESFGLVLIEAWARGKPVIVADIPSLQELSNNTGGGLSFSSKSQGDLSKKIIQLINNPSLCQKLGKNGLEYVKNNYTWNQVKNTICQNL